MAHRSRDPQLGPLRELLAGADNDHTDGQLLERFVAQQEEAFFSLLMRRHGPLVLGLCRRLLGNDLFLTRLGTISESGAPVNRSPLFGAPCGTVVE